jgi:hypothetical protein
MHLVAERTKSDSESVNMGSSILLSRVVGIVHSLFEDVLLRSPAKDYVKHTIFTVIYEISEIYEMCKRMLEGITLLLNGLSIMLRLEWPHKSPNPKNRCPI